MKQLITIITVSFLLSSCSSQNESNNNDANISTNKEVIIEKEAPLEPVPQAVLNNLIQYTTNVEGSMYQVGGSFAIQGENSRKLITFISNNTPTKTSNEHVGHLMFVSNGESLLIMNVYKINNSVYGQFDIDGKKYYNVLTGQISNMFLNVKFKAKPE